MGTQPTKDCGARPRGYFPDMLRTQQTLNIAFACRSSLNKIQRKFTPPAATLAVSLPFNPLLVPTGLRWPLVTSRTPETHLELVVFPEPLSTQCLWQTGSLYSHPT